MGVRGATVAVCSVCYYKSVRGREKQVGRIEGDEPESWKKQTLSL